MESSINSSNNLDISSSRFNRMKDYVAVAGQLGVTHLLIVSETSTNAILRIAKHPDGPTLHFRIVKFSLCGHISALQKRPFHSPAACESSHRISFVIAVELNLHASHDASTGGAEQLQSVGREPLEVNEDHLSKHVPYYQCEDREAQRLQESGALPLRQGGGEGRDAPLRHPRNSSGDQSQCQANHTIESAQPWRSRGM